jgi:hypothetical protein
VGAVAYVTGWKFWVRIPTRRTGRIWRPHRPRNSLPGAKQQVHEADHLPPSSTEVNNEWSWEPSPPWRGKHDKPSEPRDVHLCHSNFFMKEEHIPHCTHHQNGRSRPEVQPKRTTIKFSYRYFVQTLVPNEIQYKCVAIRSAIQQISLSSHTI